MAYFDVDLFKKAIKNVCSDNEQSDCNLKTLATERKQLDQI